MIPLKCYHGRHISLHNTQHYTHEGCDSDTRLKVRFYGGRVKYKDGHSRWNIEDVNEDVIHIVDSDDQEMLGVQSV